MGARVDHSSGTYFALLADYYTGNLDKEGQLQVEAHVVGCESCQELLRTMALLSGVAPEEMPVRIGGHPTLEELVRFYRGSETVNADLASRIKYHLANCRACVKELEFLDEVESELMRSLSSNGTD